MGTIEIDLNMGTQISRSAIINPRNGDGSLHKSILLLFQRGMFDAGFYLLQFEPWLSFRP